MSILIVFIAVVIFSCIITNKFSNKLGMPSLVFFMFLGILFGSDGFFKISFEDYELTATLCSIGLVFIIFYGGFCTKKPENNVMLQAGLLSSLGTILTAGFCTLFCAYALKLPLIESFLIGAILSSTDAEFSDALIDNLLSEYEKLSTIGEEKLGIDYKEFNLYVECLQNSFTIDTSQFIKIGRFFPKVNITYIQE